MITGVHKKMTCGEFHNHVKKTIFPGIHTNMHVGNIQINGWGGFDSYAVCVCVCLLMCV